MLKFYIERKQYPVRTGNAQTMAKKIETWQIRLHDADGRHEGLGEIALWPHLGIPPTEIEEDVRALGSRDFDTPTAIETLLTHETFSSPARYGFELALLDYWSKTRECSLGEFLWQRPVGPVTCHRLVGIEMLQVAANDSIEREGIHLKVKVNGANFTETLPWVQHLIAKSPPKSLRIDANGSLDYESASYLCEALESTNLILEQPFAPTDLASHDRLQRQTSVVIALDESMIVDPSGAESTSCQQLVMKPMYTGGLFQTRDNGLRLIDNQRSICITHVLESAVGRGGASHLAAGFSSTGPHGVGHPTEPLLIHTKGQIGHGGSFG